MSDQSQRANPASDLLEPVRTTSPATAALGEYLILFLRIMGRGNR